MLSLLSVSKTFPSGDGVITAVDNVSLHVSSGEFVALVGRSGSGKTTLLNLIGGLDVPDSGTVSVNGTDISRMKEKKLTLFRRKNIGCVFQFFNLVPELTAWENILFPCPACRDKARHRQNEQHRFASRNRGPGSLTRPPGFPGRRTAEGRP